MAGSFAALRAKQGNTIEAQLAKIEKDHGGGRKDPLLEDETFWDTTHIRDKSGSGSAVVRFLPATEGEDSPYVTWEEYQFEGPNGWYINRSRMSLGAGEKDPVYAYNGDIFRKYKDLEERKKRLLGRRRWYVANIHVITDPNKPENEGKNFKWRFGPQVFNMIKDAMAPDLKLNPGAKAIDPFDPFEGANFTLRVITKQFNGKGVPNYEKSSFGTPISMVENPEDFDVIWAKQYPLAPIMDPKHWDSYENLVKRFNEVMGINQNFLDSDEPISQEAKARAAKTTAASEPKKSMQEEMDDSLPDDVVEAATPQASEFQSSDDDDWFADLKKKNQ